MTAERQRLPETPRLPLDGDARDGDLERRARIAWSRIAEPEDDIARTLIATYGVVDALEVARRGRGSGTHGASDRFLARCADLDIDRDLAVSARVGSRVLVPGDPEWPGRVDDLEMPPWALWVHGPLRLDEASVRAVAVVGARASTPYGEHVTGQICAGLATRGVTVVSGAAFGIDGAAHRAALAVEGPTVAVLACGVDRSYPAAHTQLIDRIRAEGAVVSEVPPGSAPMRTRFLARNRVIAALAGGTVLVEAGLRSGARRTVSVSCDLDRPVAAVPGPVTSMVSAGCHEEIRNGRAVLVTDADEVVELVGRMGEDLAPFKQGSQRSGDGLDDVGGRVWQCLPTASARPMAVDDLTRVAGLGAIEVIGALGRLEVSGDAQRRDEGWTRRRR